MLREKTNYRSMYDAIYTKCNHVQDNFFIHLYYKRIEVCMGIINKLRIVTSLKDRSGIELRGDDRSLQLYM